MEAQLEKINSDLFWLSLGPDVLPFLTYEHTLFGSVDKCVKWHKGHDAGQTETACFNLHTNLRLNITPHSTYLITIPYLTLQIKLMSVIMKEFVSVSKYYQVIFVSAFTFDISMATNCIKRELIGVFTV